MKRGFTVCCRYYIEPEDVLLAQLADAASRSPLRNRFLEQNPRSFTRSGEVSPDSLVPVLATSRNGRKACFLMQWGFHCDNRPLLPNARLETAAVKPLFQSAWKSHRCVIPASWYYEWEHFLRPDGKKETKDKYLIQPRGESITCYTVWTRPEPGSAGRPPLTAGGSRSFPGRPLVSFPAEIGRANV